MMTAKGKDPSRRLRELQPKNRELQRLIAHFQALLEHSDDFILISDANARPVIWNSAYAAIMKKSLDIDMVPGLQPHKLLDSPEQVAWWDAMHRRVLGGERFRQEYTHTLPGGEVVFLELSYAPIRENDAIVGFLEITRDITRRRRAQEALKASEERLRLFFEHAPIGVLILAPDLQILSANPAICHMLEARPDELETRSLEDLLEANEFVRIHDGIQTSIQDVQHFEMRLRRGDGGMIRTRMVLSRVRNGQGDLRFAIAMVEDISERLALEAQVRHAHKMEAIGTLAAGIAHDFNNILGIVLGNTELVMDEVPDWSQGRDCLQDIQEAALRAKEMVREILTFGREATVETRPMALTPVVRNALRMVRATMPAAITIQEAFSAERDVVEADPAQINQVVQNLCTNAAEAMPAGGTLTVSVMEREQPERSAPESANLLPGPWVVLQVADTGPGIPEEIRDRIFDPYFSTRGHGRGSGMGLSVVHGIVSAAGGEIVVDGREGGGAVFSVLLPRSERPEKDSARPLDLQAHGHELILFIDDEPFLAKLGKRMLEPLGYTVDARTDPLKALEFFRQAPEKIDLVITDMSMPDRRGDHLAAELLRIRPDIPIILCTGHSEVIDEEKALTLGIRAFLLKPFDREALAAMVRKVLDERKS